MNPSMPDYSSNGCQVVAGRPRVLSRGWDTELGPWAEFVDRAYARRQARYSYALFSGREVLALSTAAGAYESRNVRFGSSGELVYVVQDALLKNGFDLGPAGADGELGWGTLQAVRQVQLKGFGPSGVDLVVGPGTAKLLGIDWPDRSGSLPPLIAPLPGMLSVGSVTAGGMKELLVAPNFRSLLPGGFFSSEPYNLSVRRSIRTNNPGALNISAWQRLRKGFAGVTQPDKAGNVTSIYVTPEHGIAAWYYLLSDRYGYGSVGSFTVGELACRYAGIADPADPAVLSYVAGWKKWVDKSLKAQTRIALADDAAMLLFAKGMFSHECGKVTPLHDDQVLEALRLERTGSLPAN